MAELCALADGTLPAERCAEVEARVAASPELQELLERQRRSVTATRALASEPVPASLEAAVEASRQRSAPRRRGRRLTVGLSLAGVLTVVVAAILVLTMGGGPGAPSVPNAARLAAQPPDGPAPAASGTGGTQLAADVQGVAFPDLSGSYGWRATGVRHGRLGGRDATVVHYAKDGRNIAYAIVAGPSLPRPPDAQTTTLGGVQFQTLSVDGRHVVTWRREGHTCVLIGDAPSAELLALASWSGGDAVGY